MTAVLMFGFTLFAYGDSIYFHTSSTSALIFIFAPLYLLFGGPMVFGIALGVGRFIRLPRHGSIERGYCERLVIFFEKNVRHPGPK